MALSFPMCGCHEFSGLDGPVLRLGYRFAPGASSQLTQNHIPMTAIARTAEVGDIQTEALQ